MDRWLIFLVAAASVSDPVIKLLYNEVGVFTLIVTRFLIASCFLIPRKTLTLQTTLKLLPSSMVGGLSLVLSLIALQHISATYIPVLFSLGPMFTIALRAGKGEIHLSARNCLPMGAAFVGVVTLSVSGASNGTPTNVFMLVVLILSVLLYSIYGTWSSEHMQESPEMTPRTLAFYLSVTAIVMASPMALLEAVNGTAFGTLGSSELIGIAYLSLACTVGKLTLYQIALRRTSPEVSAVYLYLVIPLNFVVSMVLLGESMTPVRALGMILVVGSAAMVKPSRPQRRRQRQSSMQPVSS